MTPQALIEVAESIEQSELIELIARFMLNQTQTFAKNVSESEDDAELAENYVAVLADADSLAQECCDYSYQVYFDHYYLGGAVEEKIRNLAEEYIR